MTVSPPLVQDIDMIGTRKRQKVKNIFQIGRALHQVSEVSLALSERTKYRLYHDINNYYLLKFFL